jgi:hypothetical protein
MSKSNKYVRGKIYKLVCNKTDLVYVGSTVEARLCRRLSKHVSDYKRYIGGKSNFITSFRIIENEDYQILLLEEYSCSSKDQLKAKEAKYIREMDCVNRNVPGRSGIEYYKDNKDKIKEHRKKYYHENQDKIKEYEKVNQDKIKNRKKEYYQANKDKLKQINYCGCGGQYTTCNKSQHEKSKKHQEYLQGDWMYIWK